MSKVLPSPIATNVGDPWMEWLMPLPEYDISNVGDYWRADGEAYLHGKSLSAVLRIGYEQHRKLAYLIDWCRRLPDHCGLSACPTCGLMWRSNYTSQAAEAIRRHYYDVPLTMSTLVRSADKFKTGDLHKFSILDHRNLLKAQLIEAGLADIPAIGAVDFLYKTHGTNEWSEHWQVQNRVIFVGADGDRIKTSLAPYYARTTTTRQPIKAKPAGTLLRAIYRTYPCSFFERVSFVDQSGHQRAFPRQSLSDWQLRELLQYLSTITFADRLLLHGFRREGAVLVPEEVSSAGGAGNE